MVELAELLIDNLRRIAELPELELVVFQNLQEGAVQQPGLHQNDVEVEADELHR